MNIFDPNCQRCPLSKRPLHLGRAVCIPGEGPEPCDILFYGEAPGNDEELENRPFVGAAGRELDALLTTAGLRRERVRISNVARCRPPDNRNPTKEEIASCMYYTIREIAAVKPKVIVALGGSAIKALTGKGEVGKNRGKLLPLLPDYRSNVLVVPTYHPAAYLHNPSNREPYARAIVEDMRLARKASRGRALAAEIVTSEDSPKRQRRVLAKLAQAHDLACDLEWEVLPQRRKEPRGMWPWSKRGGKLPRRVSVAIAARIDGKLYACAAKFGTPAAKRIRRLIADKPTYGHHFTSDLTWLYAMGWPVFKVSDDTLLLASLLNFDTSLSLKALAASLTKMPAGWEQEAQVGVYPRTQQEWRDQLLYNARDACATALLRPRLLRIVKEREREDALPLYRHVLLPAVSIFARTAINGVPVDVDLLKKFGEDTERKLSVLYRNAAKLLSIPQAGAETVLRSDHQLGPILEQQAKVVLPRTRKTNRPSVTGDLLSQMQDKHLAIPKLLRARQLDKRQNSYWRPWYWLLLTQGDERLHTVYRLTHARTGRTSAEGEYGNTFQQFIRDDKARGVVKAREGWCILAVDQSQIELRVAAWLANERRMLRYFQEGVDIHRATAGYIKALDKGLSLKRYLNEQEQWWAGVTYEERYGAKAANFGLLYFGSKSVLQRTARKSYGITLSDEQAQTAVDAYFTLYEDLPPWHTSCWRYVEQGWVDTPMGRRRPLVFSEEEDEEARLRKAINTPVQSFASDLSLFCMDYTWELLEQEYGGAAHQVAENIGFFHDAEQLHINIAQAETIRAIVKHAWEHPPLERLGITLPVPLVADIKIGERWEENTYQATV